MVAAVIVFILMSLITADVTGRYLFASPVHGTYEISRILLVFIVMLSFAYAQSRDAHVKVETLTRFFPGRARAVVKLFTLVVSLFICGAIVWGSTGIAWNSWRDREFAAGMISVPIYPGKAIVFLGFFLFCLILIIQIVNQARGLRSAKGGHQ